MKYFIDTEFIEGFHKPLLGKRRHFIDLISIGIVAEDGRQYYAISNEYQEKDASQWVKDNVLKKIFDDACNYDAGIVQYGYDHFRSIAQIANEIIDFINPPSELDNLIEKVANADCWIEVYYPKEFKYIKDHNTFLPKTIWLSDKWKKNRGTFYNQPQFYAYYSDYDWVLFCSLFGTMMDLPKGFPMYCIDLKQTLDEKANRINGGIGTLIGDTKEEKLEFLKNMHPGYPKQINEHNALGDARWNFELYKFLQAL